MVHTLMTKISSTVTESIKIITLFLGLLATSQVVVDCIEFKNFF